MKASINGELTFLKIVNLEIDRVFRLKQLNKFIQSGQIGCTINYISVQQDFVLVFRKC